VLVQYASKPRHAFLSSATQRLG